MENGNGREAKDFVFGERFHGMCVLAAAALQIRSVLSSEACQEVLGDELGDELKRAQGAVVEAYEAFLSRLLEEVLELNGQKSEQES